jgi:hypothetical protein
LSHSSQQRGRRDEDSTATPATDLYLWEDKESAATKSTKPIPWHPPFVPSVFMKIYLQCCTATPVMRIVMESSIWPSTAPLNRRGFFAGSAFLLICGTTRHRRAFKIAAAFTPLPRATPVVNEQLGCHSFPRWQPFWVERPPSM